MNIPDYISQSAGKTFCVKNTEILSCGSEIRTFLTLNPGSGMEKLRSGINHPGIRNTEKYLLFHP
jgi:hypothetical protein